MKKTLITEGAASLLLLNGLKAFLPFFPEIDSMITAGQMQAGSAFTMGIAFLIIGSRQIDKKKRSKPQPRPLYEDMH